MRLHTGSSMLGWKLNPITLLGLPTLAVLCSLLYGRRRTLGELCISSVLWPTIALVPADLQSSFTAYCRVVPTALVTI